MNGVMAQGFPLWARRVSDDSDWIVIGWRENSNDGAPIPVLVSAGPDTVGVAGVQPGERFSFWLFDPAPYARRKQPV